MELITLVDIVFIPCFIFRLQFNELEELGFIGFSIGFYDECSWVVGTSATLKCFTPELLEYLHAVVIAGGHVCIRPLKL